MHVRMGLCLTETGVHLQGFLDEASDESDSDASEAESRNKTAENETEEAAEESDEGDESDTSGGELNEGDSFSSTGSETSTSSTSGVFTVNLDSPTSPVDAMPHDSTGHPADAQYPAGFLETVPEESEEKSEAAEGGDAALDEPEIEPLPVETGDGENVSRAEDFATSEPDLDGQSGDVERQRTSSVAQQPKSEEHDGSAAIPVETDPGNDSGAYRESLLDSEASETQSLNLGLSDIEDDIPDLDLDVTSEDGEHGWNGHSSEPDTSGKFTLSVSSNLKQQQSGTAELRDAVNAQEPRTPEEVLKIIGIISPTCKSTSAKWDRSAKLYEQLMVTKPDVWNSIFIESQDGLFPIVETQVSEPKGRISPKKEAALEIGDAETLDVAEEAADVSPESEWKESEATEEARTAKLNRINGIHQSTQADQDWASEVAKQPCGQNGMPKIARTDPEVWSSDSPQPDGCEIFNGTGYAGETDGVSWITESGGSFEPYFRDFFAPTHESSTPLTTSKSIALANKQNKKLHLNNVNGEQTDEENNQRREWSSNIDDLDEDDLAEDEAETEHELEQQVGRRKHDVSMETEENSAEDEDAKTNSADNSDGAEFGEKTRTLQSLCSENELESLVLGACDFDQDPTAESESTGDWEIPVVLAVVDQSQVSQALVVDSSSESDVDAASSNPEDDSHSQALSESSFADTAREFHLQNGKGELELTDDRNSTNTDDVPHKRDGLPNHDRFNSEMLGPGGNRNPDPTKINFSVASFENGDQIEHEIELPRTEWPGSDVNKSETGDDGCAEWKRNDASIIVEGSADRGARPSLDQPAQRRVGKGESIINGARDQFSALNSGQTSFSAVGSTGIERDQTRGRDSKQRANCTEIAQRPHSTDANTEVRNGDSTSQTRASNLWRPETDGNEAQVNQETAEDVHSGESAEETEEIFGPGAEQVLQENRWGWDHETATSLTVSEISGAVAEYVTTIVANAKRRVRTDSEGESAVDVSDGDRDASRVSEAVIKDPKTVRNVVAEYIAQAIEDSVKQARVDEEEVVEGNQEQEDFKKAAEETNGSVVQEEIRSSDGDHPETHDATTSRTRKRPDSLPLDKSVLSFDQEDDLKESGYFGRLDLSLRDDESVFRFDPFALSSASAFDEFNASTYSFANDSVHSAISDAVGRLFGDESSDDDIESPRHHTDSQTLGGDDHFSTDHDLDRIFQVQGEAEENSLTGNENTSPADNITSETTHSVFDSKNSDLDFDLSLHDIAHGGDVTPQSDRVDSFGSGGSEEFTPRSDVTAAYDTESITSYDSWFDSQSVASFGSASHHAEPGVSGGQDSAQTRAALTEESSIDFDSESTSGGSASELDSQLQKLFEADIEDEKSIRTGFIDLNGKTNTTQTSQDAILTEEAADHLDRLTEKTDNGDLHEDHVGDNAKKLIGASSQDEGEGDVTWIGVDVEIEHHDSQPPCKSPPSEESSDNHTAQLLQVGDTQDTDLSESVYSDDGNDALSDLLSPASSVIEVRNFGKVRPGSADTDSEPSPAMEAQVQTGEPGTLEAEDLLEPLPSTDIDTVSVESDSDTEATDATVPTSSTITVTLNITQNDALTPSTELVDVTASRRGPQLGGCGGGLRGVTGAETEHLPSHTSSGVVALAAEHVAQSQPIATETERTTFGESPTCLFVLMLVIKWSMACCLLESCSLVKLASLNMAWTNVVT